jgi:hypothetical protein
MKLTASSLAEELLVKVIVQMFLNAGEKGRASGASYLVLSLYVIGRLPESIRGKVDASRIAGSMPTIQALADELSLLETAISARLTAVV